eukprot:2826968-Pyramimonas_sp.AAC.1
MRSAVSPCSKTLWNAAMPTCAGDEEEGDATRCCRLCARRKKTIYGSAPSVGTALELWIPVAVCGRANPE